jgi:hypothetical protein
VNFFPPVILFFTQSAPEPAKTINLQTTRKRVRVVNTATSTSVNSSQLFAALAQFSTRQFNNEQEMVTSVLNSIADALGMRTPFLASTVSGIFELLDTVNRNGCTLQAGALLPLPDSY